MIFSTKIFMKVKIFHVARYENSSPGALISEIIS